MCVFHPPGGCPGLCWAGSGSWHRLCWQRRGEQEAAGAGDGGDVGLGRTWLGAGWFPAGSSVLFLPRCPVCIKKKMHFLGGVKRVVELQSVILKGLCGSDI